jgi:hypothetical protein
MIGRMLTLAVLLMIAAGTLLHFQVEIPFFTPWMGHLPGDLILSKGDVTIYLPAATGFLLSVGLTLFAAIITGKA